MGKLTFKFNFTKKEEFLMKRVFSTLLAFTVIAAFTGTSGQVKWAKKNIGPKARAITTLPGGTLEPASIIKNSSVERRRKI